MAGINGERVGDEVRLTLHHVLADHRVHPSQHLAVRFPDVSCHFLGLRSVVGHGATEALGSGRSANRDASSSRCAENRPGLLFLSLRRLINFHCGAGRC